MRLYIDTSERGKIVVGIDDRRFETLSKERSSQRLLPFIDETLKKNDKSVKDITEIVVAVGPGSFTGLRVGISVANTLAWVLKVPVNGKKIETDICYS